MSEPAILREARIAPGHIGVSRYLFRFTACEKDPMNSRRVKRQ